MQVRSTGFLATVLVLATAPSVWGQAPPRVEVNPTKVYENSMVRARRNGDNADHLSVLDMGVAHSPLRRKLGNLDNVPQLLRRAPGGFLRSPAAAFPRRGERPATIRPITFFDGRDFVENGVPCISHACVAVATMKDGQLHAAWYGKNATKKEQFWSATKHVNALAAIADLNSRMPTMPIKTLKLRERGAPGTAVELPKLLRAMISYKDPRYRSNRVAAALGRLVGNWGRVNFIKQNTGSTDVEFSGGYSERRLFTHPELVDAAGRVVKEPPSPTPKGHNHVSAYDLTRLSAMATWHLHLRKDQRIPGVQLHSLDTLNAALTRDSARYMDDAIIGLGLQDRLKNVAITSKMGFGQRTATGRWNLVYNGAISFDDTGYASPVHRSMAFTLRADVASARSIDSRMVQATHVLLGKLVNGEL
jgi:hypothetical protein